jgi:hypothetical protein
MATPKEAHALVTYFGQKYKEKYGVAPIVNRYQARWGFDSLLMDMSTAEVKRLIEYYFTTPSRASHSLEWFFNNYDKLAVAMEATEEDVASLARIREETRRRTLEWREKRGLKN